MYTENGSNAITIIIIALGVESTWPINIFIHSSMRNRFRHLSIVLFFILTHFSFLFFVFLFTIDHSLSLTLSHFQLDALQEIDIAFKVFIAFSFTICSHTGIDNRENETILTEMACQNHQHFISFAQSEKCVSWYRFQNIYFVAAPAGICTIFF